MTKIEKILGEQDENVFCEGEEKCVHSRHLMSVCLESPGASGARRFSGLQSHTGSAWGKGRMGGGSQKELSVIRTLRMCDPATAEGALHPSPSTIRGGR